MARDRYQGIHFTRFPRYASICGGVDSEFTLVFQMTLIWIIPLMALITSASLTLPNTYY